MQLTAAEVADWLVLSAEILVSSLQCTNEHMQEAFAAEKLVKSVIFKLLKAAVPALRL